MIEVIELFLELRASGICLSYQDEITLTSWERNKIKPQFICDFMIQHAYACEKENKVFPRTLAQIDKIIRKKISDNL